MSKNESIIKIGLSLFVITFVVALSLAVVNSITEEKIIEYKIENEKQARLNVIDADDFVEIENQTDNEVLDNVYKAIKNEETVGYCITVKPVGFSAEITTVVGIDLNGSVTGIFIVDLSETPGLGAKATEEEFLNKFIGINDTIKVVKGQKDGDNSVVAITGATITTRAVSSGVDLAVDYFNEYLR